MKFENAKKIEEVIKGHREFEKTQYEAIYEELKAFKGSYAQRYTKEGLKVAISEIISSYRKEWQQMDKLFNDKIQVLISNVIKETKKMITPKFKKPADYNSLILIARDDIKSQGKDITDEVAYMFLKDMVDDLDEMKKFRQRIQSQKGVESLENAIGETTFPLTFGKLHIFEGISNKLDELAKLGAYIFLTKKETTPVHFLDAIFEVPNYSPVNNYHETVLLEAAARLDEAMNKEYGNLEE